MKRQVVLLLALLLVLIAAAPVSADSPVVWSDQDHIVDWFVGACTSPDFEVWDHSVHHESETAYFDRDGNLLRTRWDEEGADNLYNANNPDYVISGPYRFTVHTEITGREPGHWTWTQKWTGVYWNIHLPGGQVYHESGQRVVEVEEWVPIGVTKETGQRIVDWEAICSALAP